MKIPTPPKADKRPKTLEAHDHKRTDDYYWLKEKTDGEVIEYLESENEYADAVMADTADLQKQLFGEMRGRIKETDTSAPVKIDEYYYYVRTEKGKEYPIYCRKKNNLDNKEEILLDQNELAKNYKYCAFGIYSVSPDHSLLAYSIDTEGSEKYTIHIKNLKDGRLLSDEIGNTHYAFEWMNDNSTFLYTTLNESLRPDRVLRHRLGDAITADEELLVEKDERFYVDLDKSKSKKYIFVELSSKVTSEIYFLDADGDGKELTVINPREQEHEYIAEHHGDDFFILSNDAAKNFRLLKAPVTKPSKDNWREVIEHREEVMIQSMTVFADYLCLYELAEGITDIRVRNLETGHDHYIEFEEEVYSTFDAPNPDYGSRVLRFKYSSMVTPVSVYEYDMDSKERKLVKREEVLGKYNPEDYTTRRVYAKSADGVEVPVSIVYRKGLEMDGNNPCWLTGYGSYGSVLPVVFNSNRLSLLERGFVFAIAHIRGGGDKGRQWYYDGKYLNKKNTFNDFIASAEHLTADGYTSPGKLAIYGGSAGGMLIGSVVNMRPELFRCAIADVPFVDVTTTMLDPSIPLTVMEYEEWGNPNDQEYYEYIRSYSPYDNVTEQNYPHLLVRAGLNDPRVQYWEPAKWVAKLRQMKTDDNLLILKTEMDQGHGGASGRYELLKEIAFDYAFTLKVLEI